MCISDRMQLYAGQRGFSLVELILAIVIVSVGLAASLIPIIVATKSSADPLVRKQSLAIAESLLEEIELKPFGPLPGGGSRALFDDVLDYNGYSTATGIVTIDGAAIPALANYNVTSVSVTPTALDAIGAANSYLITVTVTGPDNQPIALSGFRANWF